MTRKAAFIAGALLAVTLTAFAATGGFPSRPRFQSVGINAAPPSGGGLTVSVAGANRAGTFATSTANGVYSSWSRNGTVVGDIGSGDAAVSGNAADFGITSRAGSMVIGTGSSTRVTINSAGNVSIGAPSSGTALAVTGQATATNIAALGTCAPTYTGNGLLLCIDGTSVAALSAYNATGPVQTPLRIYADGVTIKSNGGSNAGNLTVEGTLTVGGASLPKISAAYQDGGASCNVNATWAHPNIASGACTHVGTGVYTISFSSAYTSNPICTANINTNGNPGWKTSISTSSTSSVSINTYNATTTPSDSGFFVMCVGS